MPSLRTSERVRMQLAEEMRDLLVQRVRTAFLVFIPVLAAFALADYLNRPEHVAVLYLLKLVQVAAVLVSIRVMSTPTGRRWAVPIAVLATCQIYANIALGAVLIEDVIITPLSLIGLSLISAAAFPWGATPQLAVALWGALVLFANAALVTGTVAAAVGYPQVSAYTALAMSVFLARLFDQHRATTLQAELSEALARVGRAMISSLKQPVLLNRLAEITAEVLGCDCVYTFLWSEREQAFLPVASYGDSAEQWEAIRVLGLSRSAIAPLLARLEHEDVVQLAARDEMTSRFCARYGVQSPLCMPLRQGSELIGIHTASHRGAPRRFTVQQERIARNIGQLASVAIKNAHLVEELEHANRLKSDFMLTVSHEFRTPLNIILGYADVILDGGAGGATAEQEALIRRIAASARLLLDLITATLDVGRFDEGALPLQISSISLPELLREIEDEMRELVENRPIELVTRAEAGLPLLQSDRVKLKVVLKNLVSNAIKFTKQGTVTLHASAAEGGIELAVADTGIGIAPEAQSVIFEAFRKADQSIIMGYEGLGLGLYIARRITELLGGNIGVQSAPGRGATFRLWLPERTEGRLAGGAAAGTTPH